MSRFLPHTHINISPRERAISVLAGSYFLIDSLLGKNKSFPEALLAGVLLYRGITGHSGIYDAIGKTKPDNRSRNVNIQITQMVNKPVREVYEFWRKLENLPLFMEHLESVESLNDSISVWRAKIPGGVGILSWKSEIVKERPYGLLGWHSLPGSSVINAGKVEFKEIPGLGTQVHVVISYHAPGGIPGEGAARMLNSYFEEMVEEDIRNFKWYVEHGLTGAPDVPETELEE